MKRKFVNGINWGFLDEYSSKHIHVDEIFSGCVSLIKIEKVKYKITVDY